MNHSFTVNGLRITWVVITLWYELGVFLSSVRHCHWPDSIISAASPSDHITPTHILLVADPQILDHRSYPERGPYLTHLTRLVVDLNLRKNWWAAHRKRPDAVVFLGDMMDGGRFDMSDDEYEGYYHRFNSIFKIPLGVPKYFIPGNHDIGLRPSPLFSPRAHIRYTSHFGALNSHTIIANHLAVLLDAPGLVEEDDERIKSAKTFSEWKPRPGGAVELVKTITEDRTRKPILLFSHIPLSRRGSDCGPLREKGTIRPGIGLGYQNTLGQEATKFLLENLRPVIVFSGDDHDYCEINHPFSSNGTDSIIKEISIKSLSMAMGIKRPGFQLLSLASQDTTALEKTHANVPCALPDQITIYLSIYVPLLLLSLAILLVSNTLRVRSFGTSTRYHSRRSSSPQHRLTFPLRQAEYCSEDEHFGDALYTLPQPASSSIHKPGVQQHLPYSFVALGRRRRIRCPDVLRRSCSCYSLSQRITRQQKHQRFLTGFVRDCRDVAVFPLTLFAIISLWISFT